MGQDKTGEAWIGRYGTEKEGMGWEGKKEWDRKARCDKERDGSGRYGWNNTRDVGQTSLTPAQFGLVWGLLELDLLMVLHTAICVGVLE